MKSFLSKITPRSAFGTPLFGDTLFGQICWAIRNRYGNDRLEELLHGYTNGQPFAVASDAFPAGYIPRPALPGYRFLEIGGLDRKAAKKKIWIPLDALEKPIERWLETAKSSLEITLDKEDRTLLTESSQPHNAINRLTGTTGEGFAPYSQTQSWYAPDTRLDCYWLLDEKRLSPDHLLQCLKDIGEIGYGRDASIGLGKFSVDCFDENPLPGQAGANACLTLAPCAPQGLGFDPARSFYQLFTRFGRHGDAGVHRTGQPFKNPVLLAKSGAVFGVEPSESAWIGQGLGGGGLLSKTLPGTVQQGYAPAIRVHLPETSEAAK